MLSKIYSKRIVLDIPGYHIVGIKHLHVIVPEFFGMRIGV